MTDKHLQTNINTALNKEIEMTSQAVCNSKKDIYEASSKIFMNIGKSGFSLHAAMFIVVWEHSTSDIQLRQNFRANKVNL